MRNIILILAICSGVGAFCPLPQSRSGAVLFMTTTEDSEDSNSRTEGVIDRRTALLTAALVANIPTPALALKAKNEALCGTGFFEHIYEYKCTAIGDIEDEGYSKDMSQTEAGVADSLMGKLGVDSGDAFGDFDASRKKSKGDKEATKRGSKD